MRDAVLGHARRRAPSKESREITARTTETCAANIGEATAPSG